MNSNGLIQALSIARDRLQSVLDSDAGRVLNEAIENIRTSKSIYDTYQRRSDLREKPTQMWGYKIFDKPLRFKISNYNNYRLRVDIICNMQWKEEDRLPCCQELVLRIWAIDPDIIYRPEFDSEVIGDLVTHNDTPLRERVMARYHFDLANPNQDGPRYHFQLGGNAVDNEFVWFPKELDLPRFVHHPLDTVLLCQFVVANFFPEQYKKISRDPTWCGAVKAIERYLLEDYYRNCLNSIQGKDSLLDCLWN